MAYIKTLFFLATLVAAAFAGESRVKKQVLLAEDDGSYWAGKYDVRELSPVLGALPDGVAVHAALPAALPALPALRSVLPAYSTYSAALPYPYLY